MSPQSRAATANTTFASRDDGGSGNACSGASSVADIARAANIEYSLHKIESEGSAASPENGLAPQLPSADASAPTQRRKRSSSRMSSSSAADEPFLSSYGSAFLSGIFADIAQASTRGEPKDSAGDSPAATTARDGAGRGGGGSPRRKKARATASIHSKSYAALASLVEGTVCEVSSPSVVSPQLESPTVKFPSFNDQVRELQDMAFPSLPQIPIAVSTSSCSTAPQQFIAPRVSVGEEEEQGDKDSPAYGWFVSTDGDGDDATEPGQSSSPSYLPTTKPDLAFKVFTAPPAPAEHDLEVQQALAADTIDDVLGDFF